MKLKHNRKISSILILNIAWILLSSFATSTFAYTLSNPKIENIYLSFVGKVKKKYTDEKSLDFFHKLDQALNSILQNKNLSNTKKNLIKDLIYLNDNQISQYSTTISIPEKIVDFSKAEDIFQEKIKENSNKNIIDSYAISKEFENISYNKDHIFLENWIWYAYIFREHFHFNTNNINEQNLKNHNVKTNEDLIFLQDNWTLGFVKKDSYEKIKLIPNDILSNTTNKYQFLLEIKDDKTYINNESDETFKRLKEITLELTKWLNQEDKIKAIYNYILHRTSYSENIDFSNIESEENQEIFSGIETFRNSNWVCWWYSKFFTYMLSFAWIWEVEAIRWLVIDAPDFPDIGHAWVKIGNTYYDPTFDDPLWTKETKTYEKYKFFGLPKDLFYTNRFTYDTIPEYIKSESMEHRRGFIDKKLSDFSNKYKNKNYLLLKPFKFREKYNIGFNEKITIENLSKALPAYEVKNFQFTQGSVLKNITTLNFFTLKEDKIEALLEQLSYNLEWYYLFKWYTEEDAFEYRLWYDVEFK